MGLMTPVGRQVHWSDWVDFESFQVGVHNGTLQKGNITQKCMLKNGTTYSTQRYSLKMVKLQNVRCYKMVHVTKQYVTKRYIVYTIQ